MWYYEKDGGTVIQIKVISGARQSGAVGVQGDYLKIKISARPEKGKANEALVDFLSERLDVPPTAIRIVRGNVQPLKIVFVPVSSQVFKRSCLVSSPAVRKAGEK
ncbi:MAG: DUF167 domain-containing protein [Patescibacteria group bacterium]